ncbi:unnamed protein product [marine sediment metagenome]|uniref:Uncharacterized protein n=1 Tax=marine sediment metagenome TaxID=412755 RepID=X1BEH7_9ZZZZ
MLKIFIKNNINSIKFLLNLGKLVTLHTAQGGWDNDIRKEFHCGNSAFHYIKYLNFIKDILY